MGRKKIYNTEEERKAAQKAWREKNKEKKAEYDRLRRESNKEKEKLRHKKYYENNKGKILDTNKNWRENNQGYFKLWREKNPEYAKEKHNELYATIEGYAYNIRHSNLQADRKYGRCGKDEDILPPLEYYIWALQQRDFYDGKQYNWSEMGLDRIYNDKPHTFANVVPCSTANNKRRGRKSFKEFCELMRKEDDDLNFILRP